MQSSSGLIRLFSFTLALCLTLLANVPGWASTPDGSTPANEHVCDGLKGLTPGLYGLCNAYCEAQDLDSFDKEPPNTKILENYRKKMQPGDPDMPCLQVPCPCWSAEELDAFTADGAIAACVAGTDKLQMIDNAASTRIADADTTSGRERCRYIDLNSSPFTLRNFSITPSEASSCLSQLQSACASMGF